MEKKLYYVSVGARDVFTDKTVSPFEFEIEATPEEVTRLQHLFDKAAAEDFATFLDTHIPFKLYHEDRVNVEYDRRLQEVYRMIYELGTPQTKRHIEELGLLTAATPEDEDGGRFG
ncbi:hypothetical protein BSNK01_13030 [Bacillaceae bacterium]